MNTLLNKTQKVRYTKQVKKLYIILCFTFIDFDTRIGRLGIMKQQNAHITPCVLLWKTIQWNCTSLVSFIPNTVVVRTSMVLNCAALLTFSMLAPLTSYT